MELASRQVIVFLNNAGRRALLKLLKPSRTSGEGLIGLAVGSDQNGVWLSQPSRAEALAAVLVKWEFLTSVVVMIELEKPRPRVGF